MAFTLLHSRRGLHAAHGIKTLLQMAKKSSISLIGPGALGSALATALHAAGYEIREVAARPRAGSQRRARELARAVGALATTIGRAKLEADIVWLCVSDDVIAPLARQLARRGSWKGKIALHSSGALSSELLAPLRRKGAAVATLHPMMTFVRGRAASLRGVWFGTEGDAAALRVTRRIARDLGGRLLEVPTAGKPLYHAIGSFSSPMIVVLLTMAEELGKHAGISRAQADALIRPILEKTIDNFFRHGAKAAMSGPLKRGDVGTIRAHLAAMREIRGAQALYGALVDAALGMLPVGNPAAIRAAIQEASKGRVRKGTGQSKT